VRLVVVGDGPDREGLERTHPDVLFCGQRIGPSLAAHYASADVFLFPSETETFGNVILEAMASGLAVVAYDYAAARIHIAHGESGVLVHYADAAAFAASAATLAGAPDTMRVLRGRARERTAAADWPSVVRQFELLLTGALAGPATTIIRRAIPRPALFLSDGTARPTEPYGATTLRSMEPAPETGHATERVRRRYAMQLSEWAGDTPCD